MESSEQVHGGIARLAGAGLFTEEELSSTCCCQAGQGVGHRSGRRAVGGHTVLADSETFFGSLPVEPVTSAPGRVLRIVRADGRRCSPSAWTPRDFPDPALWSFDLSG